MSQFPDYCIGPEDAAEAHDDDLWDEAEKDPEFIASIEKQTAGLTRKEMTQEEIEAQADDDERECGIGPTRKRQRELIYWNDENYDPEE